MYFSLLCPSVLFIFISFILYPMFIFYFVVVILLFLFYVYLC